MSRLLLLVILALAPGGAAAASEAAPPSQVERRPAVPWPGFRGPALSGIGDGQGAPTEWNGKANRNVRWRTPIPGIGLSSPIVWGDRDFVTTAVSATGESTFRIGLYGDVDSVADDSEHTWKVYALDRGTGEIVWERTAAVGVPKKRRHLKSSHANPTPVTDGEHLVVHFASEGLFGYSVDGELLWRRDGPTEIVTNARTIRGYDARTGAELWTLGPNSELTVGSPVVGGGVAYVTGGYPPVRPIYAIRPGGRGDLSLPEGATSSERR